MKCRYILYALVFMAVSMGVFSAPAWAGPGPMGGRQPYGGYCEGPRWGWYGARTPVTSVEDARRRLENYFEGRDILIGTIVEQRMFFKADIKDRDGRLIDQVIIHKRSGRIRSTF
jgi:hypothetical protein